MTDEELREAMRPISQEQMKARQLAQAAGMRNASDEDLWARYGDGLLNQERYRAAHQPSGEAK